MSKSTKFSPEVRERAVRMVFDAKDQYECKRPARPPIHRPLQSP
ncbi:hypothetical protein ACFSQE_09945 [Vogesella fluminis]